MRAGWLSALLLVASTAAPPAAADDVRVYRCESADGGVALQDEPCADGERETTLTMTRPRDPPPRPAPAPPPSEPEPEPGPATTPDPAAATPWPAPPPLFQCTDYDGDVRHTEEFAPNTRCVPLPALGYDVRGNPAAAATCRWVQESCLRLDDAEACAQFRVLLARAESDALHAFSDTAAFRRSEVQRLRRIVGDCRK